jgi:hypothetical protein
LQSLLGVSAGDEDDDGRAASEAAKPNGRKPVKAPEEPAPDPEMPTKEEFKEFVSLAVQYYPVPAELKAAVVRITGVDNSRKLTRDQWQHALETFAQERAN